MVAGTESERRSLLGGMMKSEEAPARGREALALAAIAGSTFLLALASLTFTLGLNYVAAVWPANAVVVAALLRSERRRWPARVLAGFVGMALARAQWSSTAWETVRLPLCNVVDILLCAGGLRVMLGATIDLTRGRHLIAFTLLGGVIGPMVSAALAAAALSLTGQGRYLADFTAWYAAKALGVLVLTPALLAIGEGSLRSLARSARLWRGLALFGLLGAVLAGVFVQTRFPFLFLVMPVLMLITFQLELTGGALALLLTAGTAIGLTVAGRGPAALVRSDLADRLVVLQIFLLVETLSVLAAAAVLAHQHRLTQSLRDSLAETEAARARAVEGRKWAQMAEEIAGVGHWRMDEKTGEVIWSDEIFRIYGLDPAGGVPGPAQLIGLYHPDDRKLFVDNLVAARLHGRPFASEGRIRRPNGEIRYVIAHGAAERGSDERIRAVFGAFMDVTEAKRAEDVLRQSEERYRLLAEKSSDIIMHAEMAANHSFRLTYVSPAVTTVLGLTEAECAIAVETDSFAHPDDVDAARQSYIEQVQEGPNAAPRTITHRARHKDGHWVWLEGRPTATFDPQTGAFRGLITIMRDVTAQKAADEAIHRSEARYRLLAENATDMIAQLDLTSRITFITPACEAVMGYTPEEMVGQKTLHLMHPEDRPRIKALMQDYVAAGPGAEPITIQYRARRKDGAWIWIEGQPTVIFDEAGAPVMTQDVSRDISERKEAEFELARAREAAEAAAVAKADFLANMSHEIRTPLTAIVGFSGLLQDVDGLPAEAQLYVRRIVTGGQSLLTVVNDILDFSKLEAGQVELDPQPFDPRGFVEGAMALVAAQAAGKGLDLKVDLDPDLPPALLADSSRLRQVLLNLLTNAIKFTDQGEVHVGARYLADEARMEVSVADTGPGIPEDNRERLFERFSQMDSSVSRRHGGTGLGLAICKNLVELMGGGIEVQSVPGQGSVFTFTVSAPTAAAPALAQSSPRREYEAATARCADILVVDDLTENRELARTLLGALGHRVSEADSGAAAVAAATRARFDLILMDMQMPGMDGLSATRAIRHTAELNRATPIVALSANVLAEQVAQCHAAGMNDHIAKPIKLEELVAKVDFWTRTTTEDAVVAEMA